LAGGGRGGGGLAWLRRVLGVAALASRWIIRQPTWLLQDLLTLIAFLVILYAWGGAEASKTIIIAWFVSSAWSLGVNAVGQEVGWARVNRTIDIYIASPVTPREYLLGLLLAQLLFLPAELVEITVLALALHATRLVLPALAATALLLPAGLFTGLAIAMAVRKPTNISALTNPVSMLGILLPPVFYPATVLPESLRPLTLLVPTSAAAELARALAGYFNVYTPGLPLAALLLWNALAVTAAKKTIKWGHE
jgi:ABC-2 type transport system permease protein